MDSGFDRGVDFKQKKGELIKAFESTVKDLDSLEEGDRYFTSKKRKIVNRAIYLLVSMIQLINGSRISEACTACVQFIESKNFDAKEIVKIAKSESIKYKKSGEKYTTKARFRHIIFPKKWITIEKSLVKDIEANLGDIEHSVLKKRVLDYLLKHHECNTHSLRYAFINYMLYEEKKEPSLVAKHVGHSSMAQLVRYTQKKEADKLFEMDI